MIKLAKLILEGDLYFKFRRLNDKYLKMSTSLLERAILSCFNLELIKIIQSILKDRLKVSLNELPILMIKVINKITKLKSTISRLLYDKYPDKYKRSKLNDLSKLRDVHIGATKPTIITKKPDLIEKELPDTIKPKPTLKPEKTYAPEPYDKSNIDDISKLK